MDIYSSLKPQEVICEANKASAPCQEEIEPKQLLFPEIENIDKGKAESERLGAALEYAKKKAAERYKEIKDVIIRLLRESTLGKDLIADRILREMGITCRGRNRDKLRRRILRAITDLKRLGTIEEYETDKRTRIRLIAK